MLSNNRKWAMVAMLLVVTGGAVQARQTGPTATMASDAPMPPGPPYAIDGVLHTPAAPLSYDEVGYAGESEGGSQGGATANGETFMPSAISAAHKTLPLPSYVEVTALDSGRTILVRINDRGPMRNDQVIALSPGAMTQLGVTGQAMVPVRVRRVNPPDQERAALRAHGRAAERLETPAALLKVLKDKLPPMRTAIVQPARPTGAAKPKPVPASPRPTVASRPGADFDGSAVPDGSAAMRTGGFVVQIGAFSSQSRAEALARKADAHVEQGGNLWRVRLGPYATQQAALAGVRALAAKGFENARIMANDAP